jgi:hypothetical protein
MKKIIEKLFKKEPTSKDLLQDIENLRKEVFQTAPEVVARDVNSSILVRIENNLKGEGGKIMSKSTVAETMAFQTIPLKIEDALKKKLFKLIEDWKNLNP